MDPFLAKDRNDRGQGPGPKTQFFSIMIGNFFYYFLFVFAIIAFR